LENAARRAICTVRYWDGNAKWYRLWLDHNEYHERILEGLEAIVQPGWTVLDVGCGSGVLSLPLAARGCEVVMVEPSSSMRNLLYDETARKGITAVRVDERRWEDIPESGCRNYDLVMASNSLHLTEIGFERALGKIAAAGPRHIFAVSEQSLAHGLAGWDLRSNYDLAMHESYNIESCYAYHDPEEVHEHSLFRKTHGLSALGGEGREVVAGQGHLWLKDRAHVHMYWWERKQVRDSKRKA
jgi:SAM-dependent methyltransferase